MKDHRLAIAFRQHQPGALAVLGADRSENVGRRRALVASRDRPRSAQGPTTGDLVLLVYPGLIREPDCDLVPIDALLAGNLVQSGGPLSLETPAWAGSTSSGWRTNPNDLARR